MGRYMQQKKAPSWHQVWRRTAKKYTNEKADRNRRLNSSSELGDVTQTDRKTDKQTRRLSLIMIMVKASQMKMKSPFTDIKNTGPTISKNKPIRHAV